MPTKETAMQFALMMDAGMPAVEAIRYFAPPDTLQGDMPDLARRWQSDPLVDQAVLTIQGKEWQEMTPMEKIQFAIDKHYTEMAYFLYSRNYVELVSSDQMKADICRKTLEAKLAGTSGALSGLDQFFSDVTTGKVSIPSLKVQ